MWFLTQPENYFWMIHDHRQNETELKGSERREKGYWTFDKSYMLDEWLQLKLIPRRLWAIIGACNWSTRAKMICFNQVTLKRRMIHTACVRLPFSPKNGTFKWLILHCCMTFAERVWHQKSAKLNNNVYTQPVHWLPGISSNVALFRLI